MCDKSENIQVCVNRQWKALEWCHRNALLASMTVQSSNTVSCISLSIHIHPIVLAIWCHSYYLYMKPIQIKNKNTVSLNSLSLRDVTIIYNWVNIMSADTLTLSQSFYFYDLTNETWSLFGWEAIDSVLLLWSDQWNCTVFGLKVCDRVLSPYQWVSARKM